MSDEIEFLVKYGGDETDVQIVRAASAQAAARAFLACYEQYASVTVYAIKRACEYQRYIDVREVVR